MDALPVVVATALIASLHAQTDLRLLADHELPRSEHAMAYDIVHRRCVLFGGIDFSPLAATMLWDGVRWTAPAPALEPPARRGHAMAYDLARGRVVLFGGTGSGGSRLADTWLWDGSNWSQAQPAHAPPARDVAAMAYAWLTDRTVLFGGDLGNAIGDDTWEWDGTDWTPRLLASHPPARWGHGMAYDLLRNQLVMYGGFGDQPETTWQYDGVAWTGIVTPTPPPSSQRVVMTFDVAAGRTLLLKSSQVGGYANASGLWSWDGAQWTAQSTGNALALPGRSRTALAYDFERSRTVMFGGVDRTVRGDTWEWDGNAWHTGLPPARSNSALTFDSARGTALLFGGLAANAVPNNQPLAYLGDTWEWRDDAWHLLQPANAPTGRAYSGIAYDSVRNRTVLFGGFRDPAGFDETWEWDGSSWNQHLAGIRPPARQLPAMTFDAARQQVVMFGGLATAPFSVLQDTWTFDGITWTQQAPAVQPPARPAAEFAFDAARGRCVLFGGIPMLSTTTTNDTWEWDGANWIARSPAHAPSSRFGGAFAYDAARRRTVLIGGSWSNQMFTEIWEWDGIDWTLRGSGSIAPPVAAMGAFDTVANRTFVFGSRIGGIPTSTTFSYGPVQPASLDSFGVGCGSAGGASLHAVDGALPWLGDTLALAVEPVPANAPVLLALGFSRTTFGGLALPASLDPLGMTGCTLFVSIDDALLAFSNGARADFALQVPTTTSLAGMQFFAQAAIGDAAANAAGIVASNALDGRVGAK